MKALKPGLLIVSLFIFLYSNAQNFSNKGKEFYLCFPQHVPSAGVFASLSIWITSDKASSGTITMANGAFTSSFNIVANGLQEIQVPYSAAHISNAESGSIIQKSIKIKVDAGKPPVVAYAQQWGQARSAATLLLPVMVLGKKYRAISFTQNGANGSGQNAKSQFQIIAVKPNTQVRVTPVLNGVTGTPFILNFTNPGDIYQYQADEDVTGSLIESIATGSGSCLPIAVFSGSSNITLGSLSCSGGSYDPLFQQLYPISTWGKNFGFIPFGDYPLGNPFRIMASEDNTAVFVDGTQVATLNAGQFYPAGFTSNPALVTAPANITADKPICVTQYAQALNCGGGGYGDPDMVILNPVEQNIKDITIFSSSQQNITRQWINVLMKTVAVPSFRLNGTVPATAWQPMPTMSGYSYLRHRLSGPGSYRMSADSGFNAIAYGFSSNYESYAYSAGTNVIDLYQQIGVTNTYSIEPNPSACTGSPFKFKVSLPYLVDSLKWDLSLMPVPPIPAVIIQRFSNPVTGPDSSTVVNGKQIYWYSLPSSYVYSQVGTFPLTLLTYAPNTEGCGTEQEISFDLEISDPPVAGFSFITPRCVAETVQFTDTTPSAKPLYLWYWQFGDAPSGASNLSSIQNPSHLFSSPGIHHIRFSTITTAGCISDTIDVPIDIPVLPTAGISGTSRVCKNGPVPQITFTGSGGSAPYTFTYKINSGTPQTVTTTGTANTVTVSAPTSAAGTFVYTLLKVENTGSSLCQQNQSGTATITVDPLPTAAITLSNILCKNNIVNFSSNNSVANAGTITNWDWHFGDASSGPANSSVIANPSHTFNQAINYTVTLKVTSSLGCISPVASQVVAINKLPKAGFKVPEVCLLDSYAEFTDTSSANAPDIISAWDWNFGDATAGPGNPNTATGAGVVQHTYHAVGNYTVTLIAITDKGCRDTLPQALQINSGDPVANFQFQNGSDICTQDTVILKNTSTITSGNITRLEIYWDNVNAASVFDADEEPLTNKLYKHKYPDVTNLPLQTYQVRMRAFSGITCFSDKLIPITVHATPKINFTDIPAVCIDVPAFVLDQATEILGLSPGSAGGVYTGDGVQNGVFDPAVAGEGNHVIKYTYTSTAGCIDTAFKNIEVFPLPTVNIPQDTLVLLSGGMIGINPEVTGTGLSYLWTPNRFLNNNKIKSPTVSATQDTKYILLVTSKGGCTATDSVFVKILEAPLVPNTFTPNGDGYHDKWVIRYLDTYPDCKVVVFTRAGQKVFESKGYKQPWDGTLNGKSLPSDTYYYIIEPQSGRKPITGYVTIIK